MKQSLKTQIATKISKTRYIILFVGIFVFLVSFTFAANTTMGNPLKEPMLFVMIISLFSCLVSLFGIFKYHSK